VLVPPTITNARLVGHTFRVSIATEVGAVYTLEYRNSLGVVPGLCPGRLQIRYRVLAVTSL